MMRLNVESMQPPVNSHCVQKFMSACNPNSSRLLLKLYFVEEGGGGGNNANRNKEKVDTYSRAM